MKNKNVVFIGKYGENPDGSFVSFGMTGTLINENYALYFKPHGQEIRIPVVGREIFVPSP